MIRQVNDESADMKHGVKTLSFSWWIRLRWMGTLFVALLLLTAKEVLGIDLPWGPVSALWGALLAGDLIVSRWERSPSGLTLNKLGGVLAFDTVLLTLFLYWTGGPMNPFSVFYLVQITLAAVVLPPRWTWGIVAFSVLCFGLLFVFSHPLDALDTSAAATHAHKGRPFSVHLQGMWLAFTLASVLIAFLVSRLARALNEREAELLRAREQAARTERLTALNTLAAGAAHELGTPLGTMALISGELERAARAGRLDRDAILDDAQVLRTQIARCRDIIEQMSAEAGESISEAPVEVSAAEEVALIKERLPLEALERINIQVEPNLKALRVPPRATAQVVAGLIRNGLEASAEEGSRVDLRIRRTPHDALFIVQDAGRGMTPEMIRRIGEPFVSTKTDKGGMGLGLYLSTLFAERLDGSLTIESAPGQGTRVTLALPQPRPNVENPRDA